MDWENNNRILYNCLRKDFNAFFENDPYFKTCLTAAQDTEYDTKNIKSIDFMDKSPQKPTYDNGILIKLKYFIKLMHSLYFVHLTNVTARDEQLISDMWKSLANGQERVKAENILTLFSAAMNLNVPEIILKYSEEESENHRHSGLFHFNENEDLYF